MTKNKSTDIRTVPEKNVPERSKDLEESFKGRVAHKIASLRQKNILLRRQELIEHAKESQVEINTEKQQPALKEAHTAYQKSREEIDHPASGGDIGDKMRAIFERFIKHLKDYCVYKDLLDTIEKNALKHAIQTADKHDFKHGGKKYEWGADAISPNGEPGEMVVWFLDKENLQGLRAVSSLDAAYHQAPLDKHQMKAIEGGLKGLKQWAKDNNFILGLSDGGTVALSRKVKDANGVEVDKRFTTEEMKQLFNDPNNGPHKQISDALNNDCDQYDPNLGGHLRGFEPKESPATQSAPKPS